MTISKTLFSSARTTWGTPWLFFLRLHKKYKFDVDAAANRGNTKLPRWFGPKSKEHKDSLSVEWPAGLSYWLNPPYGRGLTYQWVKKAYEESRREGTTVVVLVPSRTCTKWWHQYAMKAHSIYFVESRIKFDGAEHGAPFPSAILVFKVSDRKHPIVRSFKLRRKKRSKNVK